MNDTPYGYGLVSKTLHWLIALIILGNLVVGLLLEDITMPTKLAVILWHKSFGALALTLMLIRFAWRSVQGFPHLPGGMPRWQQDLARLVHVALYPVLIAMPVTGWLYSSASGYPVIVFGLFALPTIWDKDKDWAHLFKETHGILGDAIIVLLAAHIGAALWHHFIVKDKIIRRML